VNDAYVVARGVPERKILGRLPSDVWPPELADKYLRTDRAVLETGRRKRYEEQRPDRRGQLRWYETIKMPVRNARGKLIGTVGISRDITDRKRAERRHYADAPRDAERARRSSASRLHGPPPANAR
jgi:hypothetical protein